MVDALLDFMLGPLRGISTFYFEYQAFFNPIIVGVAAWKLFSKKRRKYSSGVDNNKNNIKEG